MAGYGLRPYSGQGGSNHSGGFTEYPILDNYATAIFAGDFMVRGTDGYVVEAGASPSGASAATSTIGVAVGFRYVGSDGTPVWSQYYDGNAANTEAFAYVADDPNQLFVVQGDGVGATTDQDDLGMNAPVILTAGSTSTGNSGTVMDSSSAAITAALAVRIIKIVKDGENEYRSGTDTNNVIVRITSNAHAYTNATVAPA